MHSQDGYAAKQPLPYDDIVEPSDVILNPSLGTGLYKQPPPSSLHPPPYSYVATTTTTTPVRAEKSTGKWVLVAVGIILLVLVVLAGVGGLLYYLLASRSGCELGELKCATWSGSVHCVPHSAICDGITQCADGSDERSCKDTGEGSTTKPHTEAPSQVSTKPPIDECGSQPCHNGATCIISGPGYLCHCTANYTGQHCQYHIGHDYPPIANAGPNVTLLLPESNVHICGHNSTDDHGIKTYAWQQVHGRHTRIYHDIFGCIWLRGLMEGNYIIQLKVFDTIGQASEPAIVAVKILPEHASCDFLPCYNGGTCVMSRYDRPMCLCPAGTTGKQCETY